MYNTAFNNVLTDERTWNTALYVRLSKEDGDKEESDSITNQKELIRNYLQAFPNIKIVSERIDDGFSGTSFERPAFTKMMSEIKAGIVNCVVVKDLSRFGRNYTEAGRYIENVFPFMGVRFISVNDGIDTIAKKSNSDNILIPFKNLINDAYCRDISIKIRSQLEIKRKKGDFIGSFCVYGYLKDESNNNRIVIDDEAAAVVRDIYKWKIDGMSNQSIANRLNDMGVLSPMEYKRTNGLNYASSFKVNSKAKWSAVTVGRILKDEIYVGILRQGKSSSPNYKVRKNVKKATEDWVRVSNTHEAIISKETFELVNSLLLKDMRIAQGEETVYLFSGILRCADCKDSMIRKTVPRGDKKYYYYVCAKSKNNKGACSSHSISEACLEKAVTKALQTQIYNVLNLERILLFIETLPLKQEEIQKIDKQIIRKKEEIKKYKDLKLNLYESLMSGIIDNDEYGELKKQYTEQGEEAEQALLMLSVEIEKILNCKGEKNFWIEQFKEHQNFVELTRKIVASLIDEIIVYDDNRINIRFKYQQNYESAVNFAISVNSISPVQNFNITREAV